MPTLEKDTIAIFEELIRAHHRDFLRFATALFRRSNGKADIDRAEEAVQEALTIAWEKQDLFLSSPNPIGWMYLTIKNVSNNMLRQDHQWAMRILQAQQTTDSSVVPPPGGELELEGMVPPEDLDLLKRLYLHGETYEEVAQELGLKKSTLAMRVHRIKKAFQKNYQDTEKTSDLACEQTTPEKHVINRGGLKQ